MRIDPIFVSGNPVYFKCLNGHMVAAYSEIGDPVDLSLHTCPVCLGKIKNPEDSLNFASVLSLIQ